MITLLWGGGTFVCAYLALGALIHQITGKNIWPFNIGEESKYDTKWWHEKNN